MRKRIIPALALALFGASVLSGPPATAGRPEKNPIFFSDASDIPAGEVCDFEYHREITVTGFAITSFDTNDDVVHDIAHLTLDVLHRNAETGYTLTEIDHQSVHFSAKKGTVAVVGVNWHLRDASGNLVVVHAGRMVFDADTGEVISFTPNDPEDFAGVLCPALGGSPA